MHFRSKICGPVLAEETYLFVCKIQCLFDLCHHCVLKNLLFSSLIFKETKIRLIVSKIFDLKCSLVISWFSEYKFWNMVFIYTDKLYCYESSVLQNIGQKLKYLNNTALKLPTINCRRKKTSCMYYCAPFVFIYFFFDFPIHVFLYKIFLYHVSCRVF